MGELRAGGGERGSARRGQASANCLLHDAQRRRGHHKATASRTSKTIDYGFDDSEPIEDVKPKAVKPKGGRGRVPSPGATKRQDARLARENSEAAELAEFEALERELAVVDPSSEQRTAPGPSFKPAAKKSCKIEAVSAFPSPQEARISNRVSDNGSPLPPFPSFDSQ